MKLALACCAALLLATAAGAADALQLADGSKLEGSIIEEDDALVVIQVAGERREVPRESIVRITRQKISYPPLPESPWRCLGPGGGGAMYVPTLSPVDPNLGLIACDMGGAYLTRDRGRTWTMLPTAQIGRYPQGLAFSPKNPRVIFVGTSTRLFRSADGGASWKGVTEDRKYPLNAVMHVLIDPENEKLVWACFGKGNEAGHARIGGNHLLIERSVDGGLTFKPCEGLPADEGVVRQLAIDSNSPNGRRTLYAASSRGLFISKDSGATWSRGGRGLGKDDLRQVVTLCDPKAKKTVVLVSGEPSGVWRSEDGESFSGVEGLPASAVIEGLAGSHANATTAWAGGADVWKTSDGGRTWTAMYDNARKLAGWLSTFYPWPQKHARGIGCDPADPDRVWFTGDMQLWASSDGGATITELNSRPVPEGAKRLAFRTYEDQGRHGLVGKGPMAFTGGGLEVTFLYQVLPDPLKKNRFYGCYADIGGHRSDDAGESWTYNAGVWNIGIKSEWRNSCYDLALHPKEAGLMWGAWSGKHNLPLDDLGGGRHEVGGVAVSKDGGASWTPFENAGLPEKPVTSVCLDRRLKGPTVYTAVFGGGIFVSRDGGVRWEAMNDGLPGDARAWRLRQAPDDALYLICARGRPGGIWRFDEPGKRWRRLDSSPVFADVRDLVVGRDAKKEAGFLAVAVSGEGGGGFISEDAGATWKRIFDQPATSLDCTPDRRTWWACGAGLWRSGDGGATWAKLDFPFAQLNDVTVDPNDPKLVWIGSAGGGIFKGPVVPGARKPDPGAGSPANPVPTPASAKPAAPAPAPAVLAARPTPAALALWTGHLRDRIRASLKTGRIPRFSSSFTRLPMNVQTLADDGTLRLSSTGGDMDMAWKTLSDEDLASLAVDVSRDMAPEQHALAGFFLLLAGRRADADQRLAQAGPLEAEVRAAFAQAQK